MKILLLAGIAVAVLAVPASAHPHGAKSKSYYGKTYRGHDRARADRGYRRYRSYRAESCAVQPSPHFQDYPYWAACAFTPKGIR